MFEISAGPIKKAQKVVLYGPEGIGKSTFASGFPNPLFIDTEGSTVHLDVERFERPTSWSMLIEMINFIKTAPKKYQTLVIDTADWAEKLAVTHVCNKQGVQGIEDIGYGKGYIYLAEEFGRLLNLLEEVVENGINVLLLAHAQMRKFEQPDEMGAYDRWELKLQKKTAPLVKEWADAVLFANYKTTLIEDSRTKSKKATGGKRVMYTTHHPAWDAKNRWDLPEMLPLDVKPVLPHLLVDTIDEPIKQEAVEEKADIKPTLFEKDTFMVNVDTGETYSFKAGEVMPTTGELVNKSLRTMTKEDFDKLNNATNGGEFEFQIAHKALADLLRINKVYPHELEKAVTMQGFFPEGTKIENYPSDFIDQVLVSNWNSVFETIKNNRNNNN